MAVKVAINGFGRIGRLAFRQMFDAEGYEVVAINDLTKPSMLAHLLKYDSSQGKYQYADQVSADDEAGTITVCGKTLKIYAEADAKNLPWGELDVDVVLECTGFYVSKAKSQAHIDAGAKKVVISAPAGNDLPTIVYSVNENTLTADDKIISAASCTTNCLAPMAKALNDYAPIQSGIMSTIHAYTGDQMVLDGPHRKGDFRRARAAAVNIVPNSTGAAKAIGLVIPELNGKLIGSAQRVPVPTGSTTILTAVVKGKDVTKEGINAAMKAAASESYGYNEEQIVSSPKIDVTQLEAGKPFIFTAEVALKPEVTLGKYKGVKVDKIDVKVSDEDIDAEINRERESNARTISVEDRAVKDGDMTVIDFEGFVDGVAFEGGKGENYPLTIGSGSFIPGFEEALVGAELNKETEVNVTFPEDYHATELAGKPAVFKCTVKEIKEKQLPDLDDEFASEVSDFDTMSEYREDVQKKLTSKKEEEAKIAKEEAVLDAVIADAQMEIPDAMLETQQRQLLENFAQRIQAQGITLEQYMQFTGLTAQTMMEQLKPEALKRIQSRLVLEAVAAAEKMEATEEDFEAEVKSMAEAYQMEADKVKELLGEQGAKQVKEDICVRKAADFIVDNAKEAKAAAKKTTKKEKAAEEKPEEA